MIRNATYAVLFVFTIAATLICLPVSAMAADSLWSHNGSTMLWHSSGQQRQITYYSPRPGLPVSPGALLFTGQRSGNSMFGTAYLFRRGCAPAPYQVSGLIDPSNQTHVVLYGNSPIRERGGCRVIGYSNTSGNTRLEFNYLQRM